MWSSSPWCQRFGLLLILWEAMCRAENFRELTGRHGVFKNATVEGADHLLTSGGLFFAPKQSDVRCSCACNLTCISQGAPTGREQTQCPRPASNHVEPARSACTCICVFWLVFECQCVGMFVCVSVRPCVCIFLSHIKPAVLACNSCPGDDSILDENVRRILRPSWP